MVSYSVTLGVLKANLKRRKRSLCELAWYTVGTFKWALGWKRCTKESKRSHSTSKGLQNIW